MVEITPRCTRFDRSVGALVVADGGIRFRCLALDDLRSTFTQLRRLASPSLTYTLLQYLLVTILGVCLEEGVAGLRWQEHLIYLLLYQLLTIESTWSLQCFWCHWGFVPETIQETTSLIQILRPNVAYEITTVNCVLVSRRFNERLVLSSIKRIDIRFVLV